MSPSPSQSIRILSPSDEIMVNRETRKERLRELERTQPHPEQLSKRPVERKLLAVGVSCSLTMVFLYLLTQVVSLIQIPVELNNYFLLSLYVLGGIGILLLVIVLSKMRRRRDPHRLQFRKDDGLSKKEMRDWKQRRREG